MTFLRRANLVAAAAVFLAMLLAVAASPTALAEDSAGQTPCNGVGLTDPSSIGPRTEAVDPSAYQDVRYVCSQTGVDDPDAGTPDKPWRSLPYALDRISSASEDCRCALLVAAGTYTGSGDYVVAMLEHVDLYGGFESAGWTRDIEAFETVLDGEETRSVVSGANNAIIDGFTISRGLGCGIELSFASPTISNNSVFGNVSDFSGGGISCSSSSPEIVNNLVFWNAAGGYGGGGIFCWSASSPHIANNVISGNLVDASASGGGIYCGFGSNPTIENNVICGNTAGHGGGFFCTASFPTVANNVILENSGMWEGGGISCSSAATVSRNVIAGNAAGSVGGGGMYCQTASPTVLQNILVGNSAGSMGGGGIHCTVSSFPSVSNNVIYGNFADGDSTGGGVHASGASRPNLLNCVIRGNAPVQVGLAEEGASPGQALVRYCNIAGGWTGDGANNIDADPAFAGAAASGAVTDMVYDSVANQTVLSMSDAELERNALTGCVIQLDALRAAFCVVSNTVATVTVWGDATQNGAIEPPAEWVAMDYHIRWDSPNRGAGLGPESDPSVPLADMDGDERAGSVCDIGVDEYNASTAPTPVSTPVPTVRPLSIGVGLSDPDRVGPRTRTVDLEAYDRVRYVSIETGVDDAEGGDAENPWRTIQFALGQVNDASATDRYAIVVAQGVYNGVGSQVIAMCEYVDLFGGFEPGAWTRNIGAWETVLDGQNQRIVVSGADNATIDGFTIRNGKGNGIYCSLASPIISNNTITGNVNSFSGGGISCSTASPVITNNVISSNSAGAYGGAGIYCLSSSAPEITNNVIVGNIASSSSSGGAIHCGFSSAPRIFNNVIAGNRAGHGGGVYCASAGPEITHNAITENKGSWDGGGIACVAAAKISGNLIAGNAAGTVGGGGIYCQSTSPVIFNNVISGNTVDSAGGGAGIHCSVNARPAVVNNVIAENLGTSADSQGGGIVSASGSFPDVLNTVLVGNAPWQVAVLESGSVSGGASVRYCNIEGGWGGAGGNNIDAAPLFLGVAATGEVSEMNYNSVFARTTLAVPDANLVPGSLRGCVIRLGSPQDCYSVVANTSNTITVWDDATPGGAAGFPVEWELHDYHITPESPNSDAGLGPEIDANVPLEDVDGDPRSGTACDIGVDEYDVATAPTPTPKPGSVEIQEVIRHFYEVILGREPSAPELTGWSEGYFQWLIAQDLDAGFVPSEMGRLFFLSEEYLARARSDAEFVTDCYNAFLYRDPSPGEIEGWTPVANRKEVVSIFANSEEFGNRVAEMFPDMEGDPTRNFVATMYLGLLDRLPDPGGLAFYADEFDKVTDKRERAKQMGREVSETQEYIAKRTTDALRVESLYRAYLGRYPGNSETDYWAGQLGEGLTTLEAMIEAFADSAEFTNRLDLYFGN